MKCIIPEISWHNRDPVLSVDVQLKKETESYYRLASGGIDAHVLVFFLFNFKFKLKKKHFYIAIDYICFSRFGI